MAAQLWFLCNRYSCSSSAPSSPHRPFARSVATEFRKAVLLPGCGHAQPAAVRTNDDTPVASLRLPATARLPSWFRFTDGSDTSGCSFYTKVKCSRTAVMPRCSSLCSALVRGAEPL